jgi:aspartate aminotransferase-like enzyme
MTAAVPVPVSVAVAAAEPIRFFLPGPTWVPPDALQAMARPVIGHRSAAFREIWTRSTDRLRPVLRTSGEAMVATGSSTVVMEAAIASVVRRDVLHLVGGAFSQRWFEISRALGRSADRLEAPLGQAVDPADLRAALRRKRYDAVALVHNETSTGVLAPLEDLARVAREESDAAILVDTVSSLAGAPVETEAWGLDVVLAGTQKALALPPGLTVFTLSERAAVRAAAVENRGFYSDLLRYRDKQREGGAVTTPAVSLVYALDVQLERIAAEGMEARWLRHADLQRQTAEWAARRGIEFATADGVRSPTVSCLKPPAGVEARAVVDGAARRGFTIGGGYGAWKTTTFRIGHMGEVRASDLARLLDVLDEVVEEARAR